MSDSRDNKNYGDFRAPTSATRRRRALRRDARASKTLDERVENVAPIAFGRRGLERRRRNRRRSQSRNASNANAVGDHPNDDVELAFRWMPTGTFEFGSRFDELKRDENDVFPARRETVERGFWLLETETTERMRLRVERGKYAPNPAGLLTLGKKRLDESLLRYELRALLYAFPTMKIHWYDALRFCRRLNELDGKPAGLKFRLPTEVE